MENEERKNNSNSNFPGPNGGSTKNQNPSAAQTSSNNPLNEQAKNQNAKVKEDIRQRNEDKIRPNAETERSVPKPFMPSTKLSEYVDNAKNTYLNPKESSNQNPRTHQNFKSFGDENHMKALDSTSNPSVVKQRSQGPPGKEPKSFKPKSETVERRDPSSGNSDKKEHVKKKSHFIPNKEIQKRHFEQKQQNQVMAQSQSQAPSQQMQPMRKKKTTINDEDIEDDEKTPQVEQRPVSQKEIPPQQKESYRQYSENTQDLKKSPKDQQPKKFNPQSNEKKFSAYVPHNKSPQLNAQIKHHKHDRQKEQREFKPSKNTERPLSPCHSFKSSNTASNIQRKRDRSMSRDSNLSRGARSNMANDKKTHKRKRDSKFESKFKTSKRSNNDSPNSRHSKRSKRSKSRGKSDNAADKQKPIVKVDYKKAQREIFNRYQMSKGKAFKATDHISPRPSHSSNYDRGEKSKSYKQKDEYGRHQEKGSIHSSGKGDYRDRSKSKEDRSRTPSRSPNHPAYRQSSDNKHGHGKPFKPSGQQKFSPKAFVPKNEKEGDKSKKIDHPYKPIDERKTETNQYERFSPKTAFPLDFDNLPDIPKKTDASISNQKEPQKHSSESYKSGRSYNKYSPEHKKSGERQHSPQYRSGSHRQNSPQYKPSVYRPKGASESPKSYKPKDEVNRKSKSLYSSKEQERQSYQQEKRTKGPKYAEEHRGYDQYSKNEPSRNPERYSPKPVQEKKPSPIRPEPVENKEHKVEDKPQDAPMKPEYEEEKKEKSVHESPEIPMNIYSEEKSKPTPEHNSYVSPVKPQIEDIGKQVETQPQPLPDTKMKISIEDKSSSYLKKNTNDVDMNDPEDGECSPVRQQKTPEVEMMPEIPKVAEMPKAPEISMIPEVEQKVQQELPKVADKVEVKPILEKKPIVDEKPSLIASPPEKDAEMEIDPLEDDDVQETPKQPSPLQMSELASSKGEESENEEVLDEPNNLHESPKNFQFEEDDEKLSEKKSEKEESPILSNKSSLKNQGVETPIEPQKEELKKEEKPQIDLPKIDDPIDVNLEQPQQVEPAPENKDQRIEETPKIDSAEKINELDSLSDLGKKEETSKKDMSQEKQQIERMESGFLNGPMSDSSSERGNLDDIDLPPNDPVKFDPMFEDSSMVRRDMRRMEARANQEFVNMLENNQSDDEKEMDDEEGEDEDQPKEAFNLYNAYLRKESNAQPEDSNSNDQEDEDKEMQEELQESIQKPNQQENPINILHQHEDQNIENDLNMDLPEESESHPSPPNLQLNHQSEKSNFFNENKEDSNSLGNDKESIRKHDFENDTNQDKQEIVKIPNNYDHKHAVSSQMMFEDSVQEQPKQPIEERKSVEYKSDYNKQSSEYDNKFMNDMQNESQEILKQQEKNMQPDAIEISPDYKKDDQQEMQSEKRDSFGMFKRHSKVSKLSDKDLDKQKIELQIRNQITLGSPRDMNPRSNPQIENSNVLMSENNGVNSDNNMDSESLISESIDNDQGLDQISYNNHDMIEDNQIDDNESEGGNINDLYKFQLNQLNEINDQNVQPESQGEN